MQLVPPFFGRNVNELRGASGRWVVWSVGWCDTCGAARA
jgi:hypothetical protein